VFGRDGKVMGVTSRGNPLIRRIKRLQESRKRRKREAVFFVEGAIFVSLAVEHGWGIETILVSEALLTDSLGQSIVEQQRARGGDCVAVTQSVFEDISQRNNPDGLAAIVRTHWADLGALAAKPTDVFVGLVGVSDPGNLGTIIRSIDAVGGAGCILVEESTDPFHPRTVRASRGALFAIPVAYAADMEAVWKWAHDQKVHTMATSARGGQPYWGTCWRLPLLLIMGSEHEGLAETTIEAADQLVTIPMQGIMSSLNVAVATSLLLYELKRVKSIAASRIEPG